jgi:hypothetical protein
VISQASGTIATAPVVVRVAGLPADTLDAFGTGLCSGAAALLAEEDALAAARTALADAAHGAVPGAPSEVRRLLLAVRRDAFNGRSFRRRLASPAWPELRARLGETAERVLELESRHAAAENGFGASFAAAQALQRRKLLEPLRDPAFLRGLALASRDLGRAGRMLARGTTTPDRKAEAALLRYVSRAAAKVSPFSTFTPVGLGSVRGDAAPGTPRLLGAGWSFRSLVRIKPYLLDQCADMLRRWPPLRERLRVELNNTLSETAPGRFLFLRPCTWTYEEPQGEVVFQGESLVALELKDPLPARLRHALSGRERTWRELVELLDDDPGGPGGGAGWMSWSGSACSACRFPGPLTPGTWKTRSYGSWAYFPAASGPQPSSPRWSGSWRWRGDIPTRRIRLRHWRRSTGSRRTSGARRPR